MSRSPFDDFDTQVQSDEITPENIEWEQDFLNWYCSQVSPWKVYEVDCDDGTHGDRIFEWVGYSDPSLL